jgi:hypothetical protein
MIGHLYRYPYPLDLTKFIYVGQGKHRDRSHRLGGTSFGRKFKADFPCVELTEPIRQEIEVCDQMELNELETIWIFRYHTWRSAWETGYNIVLPGLQDYINLGYISSETHRIRGIGIYGLTQEQHREAGRLTQKLHPEIMRANGLKAVESGQLLAAAKKGGLIQGPINGRLNVENGHLDRIRKLPQAKEAQKRNVLLALAGCTMESRMRGGKVGGKIGGRKAVEIGHIFKIQKACLGMGGKIGGPKGMHRRWHVNRGIVKEGCKLCELEKTV